jgi:uncharacterized protein (DUF305 family)
MGMPKTAIAAVLVGVASVARAMEYENDDDDRSAHVPVVAHEISVLAPAETIDPENVHADLEYVAAMKRHHEGAVIMSSVYLDDTRGTNPSCGKWPARSLSTSASRSPSWTRSNGA